MVNGHSLKRVREVRHFELPEVANYTGISPDRLAAFEAGKGEPSFRQLEQLAAIYGLPSFLLATDTIPNLPETIIDFRRSPPSPAHVSPAGMARVWSAENVSTTTAQLAAAVKFSPAAWSKDVPVGEPSEKLAHELRGFFDVWHASREKDFAFFGDTEQKFLAAFRLFIEAQGSIVRVNEAPADDYFGFFIKPNDGLETIFVNRRILSTKAQLFTLLHEFSHKLLGLTGISNPFVTKNATERTCNKFAAEFIAPANSFDQLAGSQPNNIRADVFAFVRSVSRASLLSQHATAIRLRELGIITQNQLLSWLSIRLKLAPNDVKKEDNEEDVGDVETSKINATHAKQIGEIGYLPTFVAGIALREKLIDAAEVRLGVGLALSLQEKAFALAKRRFDLALK